ncbi:DUF4352 domain-containing protein [Candidatus Saccharibacteria bacterium]|nr:DUF4352 domain-containing protein [Candidatus Saccharibacteria bacterium]
MPDEVKSPKKKNWFARHKVLSVILFFVIFGTIGAATSSSTNPPSTSSSSPAAKTAADTTPKIGQPASDGKFQFTVNKLTCGETTIGTNPYAQVTAQGQYCRLNVTIKNTGTQSQDLSDSNQYVFAANGNKYSADSTADIYAQPDSASGTWLATINPGNSVTGDIIYDVPKGTTPTTAELHDSAFSGGVKVLLIN